MFLELALLVIPGLANLGFFNLKILKITSIASAILTLAISIYFYFVPQSVTGIFFITKFNSIFLVMITSIYLLSAVYSTRYIEKGKLVNEKLYYVLMNFFVITMLFAVTINNFGLMWVGIELTTVSSALLIPIETSDTSLEATWRYIIIVSAGVTIALFSVILIYYQYQTLTVSEIINRPVDNIITRLAVILGLIGFGTKVGVFPMYTWLPDAHSEAPSPVSAIFSGVLLPSALYVLFRVYQIDPLPIVFTWFGVVSIVTAAIILTYQWHIKRMFAYSTIENMNLALIGLAIGQPIGALILLFAHAFGKAGAFYSSGIVLKLLEEKRIDNITGLHKFKLTSTALLLSSLTVTGTPPFATFIGEFLILQTLIQQGFITEFIILILSLATAFISINYNVSKMIFSKQREDEEKKEEPLTLSLTSFVSSIIPLVLGLVLLALGVIQ